jgi:hypothetical protein
MRGGYRPSAGRKAIPIDIVELEKLCSIHCTDEELAAFFGVSVRTIEARRKIPEFAEAMKRGLAKGCISLRRSQMKLVEKGNAPMTIWMGKQWLGQRDVRPIEVSGPNGKPVKISWEAIHEILDNES